jgi:hypothetical protein
MRRNGQVASAALAALLLTAGAAQAQAVVGTIGGEIMDRRGRPLVNAHVDLQDNATGRAVSVLSDANGNYVLNRLPADHDFAMTVRCIGFSPQRRQSVTPSRAGAMAADVTLEPISESVVMLNVAGKAQ